MAAANNGQKDVIYVDVDDEITSIIDKVSGSKSKIVALVLPKRATVLQSIVNMKLLKRSGDEADKNIVLITNEAGLLPLAGAVGLHVAATPQSKPAIPRKPGGMDDDNTENVDESEAEHYDFRPKAKGAMAVGALAGAEPIDDTIQLDNEDTPPGGSGRGAAAVAGATAGAKAAKHAKGKNKKLKVPNFNQFRTRLIIGGVALVALIVFLVFANVVLPKASIVMKTDSEDVDKTLDVTFDTKAAGVDVDELAVPAVVEQMQKTTTQQVEATGQSNQGEKARGQVTVSLNDCSQAELTIPAGTGISSGGQTFVMQQSAQLESVKTGNQCRNSQFPQFSSDTVNVVAVKPGAAGNIDAGTFTVSGSANSYVTAKSSSAMSGGTDVIVKSVQQSDIDSAKQKLATQTDNTVKGELVQKLEDKDLYVIEDSFNGGTPEITASAKAGDQTDTVTVTQKTTYSIVGAKQSDLEDLITKVVEEEIDTSKQKVLKTGFNDAKYKVQNQQISADPTKDGSKVVMSMNFTALAGPQLDDEALKAQVAGKKSAEAKSILTSYPGVTDVEVEYSPFWVPSIPSKTDKITITYEK